MINNNSYTILYTNTNIINNSFAILENNFEISMNDLPKKIIVGKNEGNRINLWAVADLKDLLNLLV